MGLTWRNMTLHRDKRAHDQRRGVVRGNGAHLTSTRREKLQYASPSRTVWALQPRAPDQSICGAAPYAGQLDATPDLTARMCPKGRMEQIARERYRSSMTGDGAELDSPRNTRPGNRGAIEYICSPLPNK